MTQITLFKNFVGRNYLEEKLETRLHGTTIIKCFFKNANNFKIYKGQLKNKEESEEFIVYIVSHSFDEMLYSSK